jgi:hypothetical protein
MQTISRGTTAWILATATNSTLGSTLAIKVRHCSIFVQSRRGQWPFFGHLFEQN